MFIAGLYVAFFPFFILCLVSRPLKYVKSKTFDKKYGTLTEEVFKKKTMYQRAYYVLFVFNRLILTLTLVYSYYQPFHQMCIIMVSQILMIAYMIKFRPFKSELQQVIAVSDEFVIVFGIILLYFLWRNQTNIGKSSRIGMGIIATIVLSMIKNMGVIIYISITQSYKNFREWLHIKLGVKERKRKQRKLKHHKYGQNIIRQDEKNGLCVISISKFTPDQSASINHIINTGVSKSNKKRRSLPSPNIVPIKNPLHNS